MHPPPPFRANAAAPRGGRPVVNLLGDDLQLPPALDTPRYDRSERGPAANRGLSVHDGFRDAVALREIARQGAGGEAPGAFSRVSGHTSLLTGTRTG